MMQIKSSQEYIMKAMAAKQPGANLDHFGSQMGGGDKNVKQISALRVMW